MAILKIARMGHEVLLATAAPVAVVDTPEMRRLVHDMAQTLEDAGGVGLAAPQVHVSLRLFIYFVPQNRGAPVGLAAVFNPLVTPLSDEIVEDWEACLSIPGLRAAVPRHEHIRLDGLDATGAPFSRALSGFEARVVQHEYDHLDGVMYPARLRDFSRFGFNEDIYRNPDFYPKQQTESAP